MIGSASTRCEAGRSWGPLRNRAMAVNSRSSSIIAGSPFLTRTLLCIPACDSHKVHRRIVQPHEPRGPSPMQTIVTTSPALSELAAELQSCDLVGLDTEFLRERSYRAELCLVQLSSLSDAFCVDPLAITDLSPIAGMLTDPAITKNKQTTRQDV